jgi:hypothetical protein
MPVFLIDPTIWKLSERGNHMGMKFYYRVSTAHDTPKIRPLNSELEVQRAIEQSSIIAKHVRENVASFFILERKVDISNFYNWLSEVDQCTDLPLEKPHYVEYDNVSVMQNQTMLTMPRF